MRFAALLALFLLTFSAEARVFNYKDSGLSAYLRGTGQTSTLDQEPFGNSSGTGTSVKGDTRYGYSGEMGMALSLGSRLNLRIGAEAIQFHPLKEAKGSNTSSVELFSLDSSVFVFNPGVTLEFFVNQAGNMRFYGLLGAGYAMVDVENRYTMTAAGTAQLGVSDFNEKMYGTGYSTTIGAGFETLFVDNVTFALDAGYRMLNITTLKYRGDVNNIVAYPASAAKDADALNHDGNKRALDLGGYYVGVAFRFYLHFL